MVSGLASSKNLSKMKSPKSYGKSKRRRHRVSNDQRSKSPKLDSLDFKTATDATKIVAEPKVKSGSWKRKTIRQSSPSEGSSKELKTKETEQSTSSSSRFRPGISYSDVLFSGENPCTLVKIRSLTPRQMGSHVQVSKSNSKGRKRTSHGSSDLNKDNELFDQPNISGSGLITLKKNDNDQSIAIPPKSSSDFTICTEHLMKRLNIEIPSWNFTNFGTFKDVPKFVCQFDDYNYLVCEKVAFVGLRLASDGKFKF